MKQIRINRRSVLTGLMVLVTAITLSVMPNSTFASGSGSSGGGGGSTSNVDTIKVNKCYYFDTGSYVELLLNATSSNTAAHLHAYLPDGTYLGEVQNGGGGRYGGTVFVTLHIPASITIISSAGGRVTSPSTPFQF